MSEPTARALVRRSPDWLRTLERRSGARLALGRAGDSMPSVAQLQFGLDHARARDAVHSPLDIDGIAQGLDGLGLGHQVVRSMAQDRRDYLRRPDLGRLLAPDDAHRLAETAGMPELVVVIADGLSAQAVNINAVPLIIAMLDLRPALRHELAVVLGEQCRVAAGDKIAMALNGCAVLILIGERPGLSSAQSMGAYLTWNPQADTRDSDRNCVSNIRADGLAIPQAAALLTSLIAAARQAKLTGIALKPTPVETLHLPLNLRRD